METRVKDVVSALEISTDDVRMIGIKGMGGAGKTTLAGAVFDQISLQFEGKSFVENVREVSNASSGLKSLQNQVLKDVSTDQDINVSSIHQGKNMMQKMMSGRKVLLVLDDVDRIDQLEALAGDLNWFKRGSRIIITTRDEQVLLAHRVKLFIDVNLLLSGEAICLFSRYAFGGEIPIQAYEELSRQVVRYADGLPLTIRVLGSFLCGKNEIEWRDALERLKTILLKETLQILELSYNNLEEDYKDIFLNVACILKGWSKDLAIETLESCGFHATNGLKVLQQKSLITISRYGYVSMHDHIEEMGRNIVRRLHPDKPEKHSRLWIDEEINNILANELGTKATRYIQFNKGKVNLEIAMKGLRTMKELRFLHISAYIMYNPVGEWKYDNVSQYFPNALQYLRWNHYPLRSLPNTFQANNLVALKMAYSRIIQLWEGGERKVLNKLKFLDLSYSQLTTLDLGLSPNLEALCLSGCHDLVQLHMLNGCRKLKSIYLSHSNLMTIDLRSAVNLELLCIDDCNALVELHMPGKCLNLRSLTLTNSKLRNLDIGQTPNLEDLDLNNCCDLEDLHMADKCQKLISINVSHSKLKTLDLGLTPNLKKLELEECTNLAQLNVPFGCLENLVYLVLSGCFRFTSFRIDKWNGAYSRRDESIAVSPLAELHLIAKSLKECPLHPDNTLRKFQFECIYKDDPPLNRNVEKLLSFGLCACTNLDTFSESICGLRRLRTLKLEGYPQAPKDIDQVESLKELSFSMTNMKHLPDSICMLKHLEILKLQHCWSLQKLPEDLGRLECLYWLSLSSTKIKHLPDIICKLKYLVFFELVDCFYLEKLPEDLGQLECLQMLYLSYAKIERLPDSIYMLKRLETLVLLRCSLLKTLPKDLGLVERLETLVLSSSMIKHLPDTICMLRYLKELVLDNCLLLEKLPEDLDRLECLETLNLSDCKFLRDIPISICNMKCLKELHVVGTSITHLPQNMYLLKDLHISGSRELLQSCGK